MQAIFVLRERSGERIGEDALGADPARAAALLADLGITEGMLFIEDPATGARAGLGDTLPVLIERFCLSGLKRLRDEGAQELDFLNHEEHLSIALGGEQVRFDSSRFGRVAFPKDAYFVALAACGERYQALMASLPPPEATKMVEDGDLGGSEFTAA
jgi:hypothetical protein